jgi:hypothetical protein
MQTKSPAIRSVIVASGALFIAAFVALTFANWTSTKPVRNLTVVYVDTDNCAPCEIWQRNPGTAFLDSPEFHRLAYREVKSPNLFDVLKDNSWPEELRGYRQAIDDGAGVPLGLLSPMDPRQMACSDKRGS